MKVKELNMINEFDFVGINCLITDMTADEKKRIADEFINFCIFVRSF